MADVFSSTSMTFGGAFSPDGAKVTFSSGKGDVLAGGVGMLAQQIQYGYNQATNRFYELGTNNVYLVKGRPEGQLSMSRILGPRKVATAFYKNYGDVCGIAGNVLTLSLGANYCAGGNGPNFVGPPSPSEDNTMRYSLSGVLLNSISGSVGAQDMVVNEQVTAMYISHDIE